MDSNKNNEREISQQVLHEDDSNDDLWKAAEKRNIMESLSLSYTERFKIMMRLMRIEHMLSRAKITHKKMP